MNFNYRYQRWKQLNVDQVLSKGSGNTWGSKAKYCLAYVVERLLMVIHGLVELRHVDYAAQLSFNTIMAIIPTFALIFAIGKGFGFEEEIEKTVREFFTAQPQVADTLVELARSYIVYTHSGWFVGIALLFMMYTVIMLIRDIESVFNRIWHVKRERNLKRTLTDYVAMIFTVPLMIILFSGMSVFFYGILDRIPGFLVWAPASKFLIEFMLPLTVMWMFFVLLFMFMPNTKVQFRYVWLPALITAFLIIALQTGYVYFQILFTSYSIIYGSFAALPLFLLWVQISWYIILVCVELSHANQQLAVYGEDENTMPSIDRHLSECLLVLDYFKERQKRNGNACEMDEIHRQTGLTYAVLNRVVAHLVKSRLLSRTLNEEDSSKVVYLLRCNAEISTEQAKAALCKAEMKLGL